MAVYCDDADVVPYLPAGGLPNPWLEVSANATSDQFVAEGHGLANEQAVTFQVATGGSLPASLVADTTYYAILVSPSRFKVSATAGGAAINITTAGSNFQFRRELPMLAWREWGSRMVDSFLPAHVVPIVQVDSAYPPAVVQASAELAALMGVKQTGGAELLDPSGTVLERISTVLARWAKSIPLRGTSRSTQSPVNLAITASAGAPDPRGWGGADATRIP